LNSGSPRWATAHAPNPCRDGHDKNAPAKSQPAVASAFSGSGPILYIRQFKLFEIEYGLCRRLVVYVTDGGRSLRRALYAERTAAHP
jgi:hypothetical protein